MNAVALCPCINSKLHWHVSHGNHRSLVYDGMQQLFELILQSGSPDSEPHECQLEGLDLICQTSGSMHQLKA